MRLFADFPHVPTEDWMAAVERDLKGADFERRLVKTTLDGVKLRPFYRAEDAAAAPGLPFPARTTLREEVREPDLAQANAHARRALERGADELAFSVYPGGPDVDNLDDLARLIDGIDLTSVPVYWNAGPLARPLLGMVRAHCRRQGIDFRQVRGGIDYDPILDRAAGWTAAPLDDWQLETVAFGCHILQETDRFGFLGVRGSFIEKAGASLAQELAFSLALFSEYLAACRGAELDLEGLVARSEIRLGIATNYLLEVAKLRAARILFHTVSESFGIQATPRLHAVTTSSNKTLYDPHNNILRATVEAVAAVVGGADSLTVAAYEQGYHTPDEFSEHLSRNTLALLRDEAHLDRVADPLAGSYTVERLTSDYSETAWSIFLEVERRGGFAKSLEWIGDELRRVQRERSRQVNTRRRAIVGVTLSPNPSEKRLADVQEWPRRLQVRVDDQSIDDYAARFEAGSGLGDFVTHHPVPSGPFDPYRLSWPFEHLRLRVERHVASGGKRPLVWLVLTGDPAMRNARAAFCLNTFGAAGYEIRQTLASDPGMAVREAEQEGADLVVLCSSDAEYAAVAQVAGPSKGRALLIVAGYPEAEIDGLRAAGVDDFVHVRQDLLETLKSWHHRFGIPEPAVRPAPEEATV